MRISEVFSQRMYLRNLKKSQADLDEALLRMSTGQKVRYGSDDPSGAAEIIRLKDESSKLGMRRNGISQARPWLQLTEQAVTDLGATLSEAWSLAIKGSSDTLRPSDRLALAGQVAALRRQVENLAGLRVAGRYIFLRHADRHAALTMRRATTRGTRAASTSRWTRPTCGSTSPATRSSARRRSAGR